MRSCIMLFLVLISNLKHLINQVLDVLFVWLDFLIELINSFFFIGFFRIFFRYLFQIGDVILFELLELGIEMAANDFETGFALIFLHLLSDIVVNKGTYTISSSLISVDKFSNIFLFDYGQIEELIKLFIELISNGLFMIFFLLVLFFIECQFIQVL